MTKRDQKAIAQLEDLMKKNTDILKRLKDENDYIYEEEQREIENLREKQQSKDLEEDWKEL